jgi:hypothetical protein
MSLSEIGNIVEKAGEGLSKIFSPARIAFAGLVYLFKDQQNIPHRTGLLLILTGLFVVIEIFHNDYLRIWLNKRADSSDASAVSFNRTIGKWALLLIGVCVASVIAITLFFSH